MENTNNAVAIIDEWNSLTTQEQINFIIACTLFFHSFFIQRSTKIALDYTRNKFGAFESVPVSAKRSTVLA